MAKKRMNCPKESEISIGEWLCQIGPRNGLWVGMEKGLPTGKSSTRATRSVLR